MERAIAEAERLVGDFNNADTGVLFTLPVNYVVGLLEVDETETVVPPPRPVPSSRQLGKMPVSHLKGILNLNPVVVQTKQSLIEIVEAVVEEPNIEIACVVNEQQRLVGLLPLQNLVDDLFATLVPAEFLSVSLDRDEVMNYAQQVGVHTAGDAMLPAVWVTDDDKVTDAFTKMHDNKLTGIPIVNDRYEVTGYINLQELLALYVRSQKTSES
jgi:CBS domain-containing protein